VAAISKWSMEKGTPMCEWIYGLCFGWTVMV